MMRIESWENPAVKAHFKIVRTDDYSDIHGEIVTAYEETGEYCICVGGQIQSFSLGPNGIRIVRR